MLRKIDFFILRENSLFLRVGQIKAHGDTFLSISEKCRGISVAQ